MGLGKKLKKIGGKALNIGTGGFLGVGVGGPSHGMFGKVLQSMKPGETHMPDPPDINSDLGYLNQFMTDTQNRYAQQQDALKGVLDKYRQNAYQNLTTGQEGEGMRQYYNRLGLLNSGAFNSALSDKFANIQKDSDLGLMQQGLGTTDRLQDIAESGLQRRFGLEDMQYDSALQGVLAKRRQQGDRRNAFIGAGGSIIGNLLGRK